MLREGLEVSAISISRIARLRRDAGAVERARHCREAAMTSSGSERPSMEQGSWSLYIVQCRDGELYVGIAQDVRKRIQEHNTGTRCRYTRYRRPVLLLHEEKIGDYASAREREREVKKYSRKKKLALAGKTSRPNDMYVT
jgi:putative endonuclease